MVSVIDFPIKEDSPLDQRQSKTQSYQLIERNFPLWETLNLVDWNFIDIFNQEIQECTKEEVEKIKNKMTRLLEQHDTKSDFFSFITELQNTCTNILNS